MMISDVKFFYMPIALFIFSLAYIHLQRHVNENKHVPNENKRILSDYICGEPSGKCQEGKDNYFSTYPDVEKKWKHKSAYSHWKRFGKAEGRGYFCACPGPERNADSEPEQQKDSGFVVIAIFKNEATNIAEWVSHYIWQGASHLYLIDNGSTDDWHSTIAPEDLGRITVTRNEIRHIQEKAYNSFLPMLREKHANE